MPVGGPGRWGQARSGAPRAAVLAALLVAVGPLALAAPARAAGPALALAAPSAPLAPLAPVSPTSAGAAGGTGGAGGSRAAPLVTGVGPAAGPVAGGTRVVITGAHFQGALAVHFGPHPATDLTVVFPTQVAVTAPAGSGTVDVTVTTSQGTSGTSPIDRFTYTAAAPAGGGLSFPDVPPGYWAAPQIRRLAGMGAVSGFPDGTFRPDAPVTRAAFVKMLDLALGLPAPGPGTAFNDVAAKSWASPYVAATVQAGIVHGLTPTAFGPDFALTREELAVFVARATRLHGTGTLPFGDAAQIDTWAREGVGEAVLAGYISGFPDRTFRPQATATRAQAAAVLALVLQRRTGRGG